MGEWIVGWVGGWIGGWVSGWSGGQSMHANKYDAGGARECGSVAKGSTYIASSSGGARGYSAAAYHSTQHASRLHQIRLSDRR